MERDEGQAAQRLALLMQRRLRLRRPSDFARLRREGDTVHHRWMLISVAPNPTGANRYGFVTSKAIGNAVVRNRVRRLLRESFRYLHPRLPAGYDIVVVAKKPIVGQPFDDIRRIVEDLLRRTSLLSKGHNP